MSQLTAVIQARMGSTRFPGKSLKPLSGAPMMEHIIKRVQQVREITRVALAVPHGASEAPLVGLAKRLKVAVIAGPEEDVLARFIQAGETLQAAHLVRVCGDNPLIDLSLLRSLARHHLKTLPDYTVSADPVPLGTGSEIVRLDSLKTIAARTQDPRYREHVTSYFHDHPEPFVIEKIPCPPYLKNVLVRLTVDTETDYRLLVEIYNHLFRPDRPILDNRAVMSFLKHHPDLAQINQKVLQKDWRRKNQ